MLLRVLTALVPHDTRGVLCAQRSVLSRAARKTQAARDYLQLAQARLRELPAVLAPLFPLASPRVCLRCSSTNSSSSSSNNSNSLGCLETLWLVFLCCALHPPSPPWRQGLLCWPRGRFLSLAVFHSQQRDGRRPSRGAETDGRVCPELVPGPRGACPPPHRIPRSPFPAGTASRDDGLVKGLTGRAAPPRRSHSEQRSASPDADRRNPAEEAAAAAAAARAAPTPSRSPWCRNPGVRPQSPMGAPLASGPAAPPSLSRPAERASRD